MKFLLEARNRFAVVIVALTSLRLFDGDDDNDAEDETRYGSNVEYPSPTNCQVDAVADGKSQAVSRVNSKVIYPKSRPSQMLEKYLINRRGNQLASTHLREVISYDARCHGTAPSFPKERFYKSYMCMV